MSDEEKRFNTTMENLLRNMVDEDDEDEEWKSFSDPSEGEGKLEFSEDDFEERKEYIEDIDDSIDPEFVGNKIIPVDELILEGPDAEEFATRHFSEKELAAIKAARFSKAKKQEKPSIVREEKEDLKAAETADAADKNETAVNDEKSDSTVGDLEAPIIAETTILAGEAAIPDDASEKISSSETAAPAEGAETSETAKTPDTSTKGELAAASNDVANQQGTPVGGAVAGTSDAAADAETIETPKKKHKVAKCLGLAAAMCAVAAGTAYAGVSYYFSNRFFDGTTINGMDVSRMTAADVESILEEKMKDYSIEVLSRDQVPQKIAGSAINYRYTSDGEVLEHLKEQKPYEWIMGYIEPKTYTVKESTTYDKELLKTEIKHLECAKAENQIDPVDAYVAYTDNKFEIVPETQGSALDIKAAYQVLENAVSENQASIDFAQAPEVYESANITSDDEKLIATLDACNNFARASITYDMGNESVVLDGSRIKDWLVFDSSNQLVQDDSSFELHIREFVDELKSKYDTVGTSREFYTSSGRVVSVYGSAYGWCIDKEAEVAQIAQDIRDGVQTVREPIYSMTANSRGTNDFGDTYIEVDLSDQHMYYYQDGYIIFDSEIVSGNPNLEGRATPPGIFTLYYKKSPEILRGRQDENGNYEYETPVQYWMPFNGGVGFHDATWQPYFGGDLYLWNGSHGCINLPYYAAATLYEIIEYNVPIIVFN